MEGFYGQVNHQDGVFTTAEKQYGVFKLSGYFA
jgi:hypothetical protein